MTVVHLKKLAENAHEFARAYITLTEALLAQGVPEERAREDARAMATAAILFEEEEIDEWP